VAESARIRSIVCWKHGSAKLTFGLHPQQTRTPIDDDRITGSHPGSIFHLSSDIFSLDISHLGEATTAWLRKWKMTNEK
jgi:hypothetical protein